MSDKLLNLTRHVVVGYVSNNAVPAGGLPALISDVAAAFSKLSELAEPAIYKPTPAVNPKRSVFPDYIICLEDGKKFKSLKRHLTTRFNITPEAYRAKWDLPVDYPMVAPNYATARSMLAKKMGLGQKRKVVAMPAEATKTVAEIASTEAAPTRRRAKAIKVKPAEVTTIGRERKTRTKSE